VVGLHIVVKIYDFAIRLYIFTILTEGSDSMIIISEVYAFNDIYVYDSMIMILPKDL